MPTRLLLLLLLATLPGQTIHADMGQIHAYAAEVSETAQKAILLHNGQEEILILGADLQAAGPAGILRFIPFPTEPQVSLAAPEAFSAAADLVRRHKLQFLMASKGGGVSAQGVELRLQEKLGAHDMTVIKVNDVRQFRDWIRNYLRSRQLPAKDSYAHAEGIVADYVRRGIHYFALDFVALSGEPRFIEPVQYRFMSAQLYYPLLTSNTFGGSGAIELLLLLPGTLCPPSLGAYDTCLGFDAGPGRGQVQASTSAAVSHDELAPIYRDTATFFGNRQVYLQLAAYWGDYSFDRDIMVDTGNAAPRAFGYEARPQPRPWDEHFNVIANDIELQEAETKSAAARCTLRPEPGPCKGLFKKFYYDPAQNACRSFIYGGCQGVVPFDNQQECEHACIKAGTGKSE